MLELFCRAPEGMKLAEGIHLTPIPVQEAVASLSAILFYDAYFEFIIAGRREVDGLPWVGADRLIPLKVSAWPGSTAAVALCANRGARRPEAPRQARQARPPTP